MNESEKVSDKIVHNFLKKTKTEVFCPIGTGGGLKNGKINQINLRYYNKVPMTIESGRLLVVNTVNNFLNYANSFPNIQEFVNEYPLNPKILNIGIIYPGWQEIPSEIKCISFVHGIIFYSIEAEKEYAPFIQVHEETFEEAEKIVAEQNLNR